MNMKPKECINNNCRNIFYIPNYKLHMLLVCEECEEYPKLTCRKCDSTDVELKHDYYGIPTGYWCDSCYNSNKYPYRKDRYATIEFDGYGEKLNPD